MGHLFPAEEGLDHVDALEEPGVPILLPGPWLSGHVLVQRLARAERGPEPAGEQVAERGDRLGGHRGVVPLSGSGHHPERQRRRLHRAPSQAQAWPDSPDARSTARGDRSTSRPGTRPPQRPALLEEVVGESCSWMHGSRGCTLGPYPQEARFTHRKGLRGPGRRGPLPSGGDAESENPMRVGRPRGVVPDTMCAQVEDPGSRPTSPVRSPRLPDGSTTVAAAGDISCPSDDSDFEGEDPSEWSTARDRGLAR